MFGNEHDDSVLNSTLETLTHSSPTDFWRFTLINSIKLEIKRLSRRIFEREDYLNKRILEYQQKFERRTGNIAVKNNPSDNFIHRHFDPKYCARNANFLAKSIWHKVLKNNYEPIPAVQHQIPKLDGGKRSIMAFSIPDAALANVVLRRARNRNSKRLSPHSYAYHPDKNLFDAIIALREFRSETKLFAVQIDFEKYFDTIPSGYLKQQINGNEKIGLTPHEKHVFERFIHHQYSSKENYTNNIFQRRHRGTPQGSSVSLLLANLASHDLDTTLSAQAGRFARFADDVTALCGNYQQAQSIERCFFEHCKNSGLILNNEKSLGIAIISGAEQEIRTYEHFDYLGYRFGNEGLGIPDKVSSRIRTKISRLVHIYLFHYLNSGFNKSRSSVYPHRYDWDLLGLIYELRRSLYGGLSEREIEDFLNKGTRLKKMRGLMSFYCMIEDASEFKKIDGWILSIIRRSMKKRNNILNNKFGHQCPTPNNVALATGKWMDMAAWDGENKPETRAPSLVRGWRAARKYYFTFGLEDVRAPSYSSSPDISKLFDY